MLGFFMALFQGRFSGDISMAMLQKMSIAGASYLGLTNKIWIGLNLGAVHGMAA
jgi:hypothetical protein